MARNDLTKNVPAKSNKLIITAQTKASKQVHIGVHIIRDNLKSTHKEADVIVPYQVSEAIADEKNLSKSFGKTLEELGNRSLYSQLHGRGKHHINKGYSKEA